MFDPLQRSMRIVPLLPGAAWVTQITEAGSRLA